MRDERALALGPCRDAVILEARVSDMRRLLALLPEDLAGLDLLTLLRARLPDLLALLDHCLRLPAGESIDDLSLSECEAIAAIWWEMHRDFFLRALDAAGYVATSAPPSPLSTGPV